MKIFGIVVMTKKKFYKELEESVVSGYFSAINGLDGKKKVYLEPVTIKGDRVTMKDNVFLGACFPDSYGVLIDKSKD